MKNTPLLWKSKHIRRIWYENQWYFSIVDVVGVLVDSTIPRRYWMDLKNKIISEVGGQLYEKIVQLKLQSSDGKSYLTDCTHTEGLFRIIQSISSPKVEPFKRWLAKVGHERIQEIQNPELAQERIRSLYIQKGYSKDWIEQRLRGMSVRRDLTDEWKERGLSHEKDFAILTAEISRATFGMSPSEYREYKNIPQESSENLRDYMTDFELIFTMLGEKVTTEISKEEKPETMPEHKKVASRGGGAAGKAREVTEGVLGKSVVSRENPLLE